MEPDEGFALYSKEVYDALIEMKLERVEVFLCWNVMNYQNITNPNKPNKV